MADDKPRGISRREMLKGAGLAGAAAAFPVRVHALEEPATKATPVSISTTPLPARDPVPHGGPFLTLTGEEAELLDAMIGRLIPADEYGPGAREAGALRYIDRELGGALSGSREAYRVGLAALDRYARYSRGAPFTSLPPREQDSLLIDVQNGGATGSGAGFAGSSGAFFNLVKGHVWQATFGDPVYGGNAGYIGWTLLGYPGVRTAVSAADQERLEARELPPVRRSAYE
jgi:gluconate 2-dehydrogenase gamma chain